jgi:hypothetical protein
VARAAAAASAMLLQGTCVRAGYLYLRVHQLPNSRMRPMSAVTEYHQHWPSHQLLCDMADQRVAISPAHLMKLTRYRYDSRDSTIATV